MPNYTTNYKLTKPLGTDLYDIGVFNDNADKIDTALHDTFTKLAALDPRTLGAIAEQAIYYSSSVEVDLNTTTHSLLLVDKKWSKDCPLCTDSGFVFVMQLFFGDPSPSANRTQVAISYGDGGDSVERGIAIRCYFAGNWTSWTELYSAHNLPVIPVEKGGTGTSGWHQALTNLRAMERQAVYYSTTNKPNIDTLTDSLMLIPIEYTKNCPVGGGFVYIMQVFYASIGADSNRTQIAFPYMIDGLVGKGIATRSFQNGKWSDWNLLASTDDHKIKTYSSLVEIGLTPGTETIEAIVNALGSNSELTCPTSEGFANVYPDIYGMLRVECIDSSRVHFRWTSKSTPIDYVGIYSASNTNKWSGWRKVYNSLYPPTLNEVGIVYSETEPEYADGLIWLKPI